MRDAQSPDALRFDVAMAEQLLGQVVLLGETYVDRAGKLLGHAQYWGTVRSLDPEQGICVQLGGVHAGSERWYPPDTAVFSAASPGEYRLRSTGEVVVDPAYVGQWTVYGRGEP